MHRGSGGADATKRRMFMVKSKYPNEELHLWQREFSFSWNTHSKTVFWSYDLYMVRDAGKRIRRWSGQYFNVGLVVYPRKWRIGSDHGWYDGPHCAYQLGPFLITHGLGWDCKKCRP